MAKHNDLGRKGEQMAVDFLSAKGYEIVERNYRYKKAEVDLIAKMGPCLVFVEVKSRSNTLFDEPENAVHQKKIDMLHSAAEHYIVECAYEGELRFDIVIIIGNQEPYEIRHIENAFWN